MLLSGAALFGVSSVPVGSWEGVRNNCLPAVARYIPPLLLNYGLCKHALSKWTGWTGLKLQRLAGMISMYPAFFALIWSSHATLANAKFWRNPEARFLDSCWECDFFANFYIATNIVQALGQVQTESGALLGQLMGHHAMSIFCYGAGFYFDRFRYWTAFAGACEITNLCLVPVQAVKEVPEIKTQPWFKWNAYALLTLFVTHRMVLFPAWLWLWMSDRVALSRATNRQPIHWVEGVVYPATISGLLVLSVMWLKQIVHGVKKLHRELADEKKRKD